MSLLLALVSAWSLAGKGQELPDDPAYDLRPGLSFSCRVKLDRVAMPGDAHLTIVRKGEPSEAGAYWLRVSHKPELASFDFFVNLGGGPEPRVRSGVRPEPGRWYDLAAGWDGTNAWLTVDGRTVSVRRAGAARAFTAPLAVGPLFGNVEGLRFRTPTDPVRSGAQVGFKFACDVTFLARTEGEKLIATEQNVYLLRYDRNPSGRFGFWVRLDGSWEPSVSIPFEPEIGRTYRVVCGWDGVRSSLSVDERTTDMLRGGVLNPKPGEIVHGSRGLIKVENPVLRNECRPRVVIKGFHSREFMPRTGQPVTMVGEAVNYGMSASNVTVTANALNGALVRSPRLDLGALKTGDSRELVWTVEPGTNRFVDLSFVVTVNGARTGRETKRIYLMPEKDPDFSAKAWAPPVRATRTWHVDSLSGDDARDGRTPATAWRTFRHVNGTRLGPGERLLLRRGSLFDEELKVSAAGAPGNWAEIGAYGEGMRPTIRRHRMLDERCVLVDGARCLAVRDLIVCNAGAGLCVNCEDASCEGVLIERCLAHHIEGLYRFNAHGIPEWRDGNGPQGTREKRSVGIGVLGGAGHGIVLRDCEAYQCSNGFSVRGWDAFVTRMYCHDNYTHNTSPHPFHMASRAWLTDSVFDAAGWHAAHGTMGVMLAANNGFVIRNCHFLNQPDSGSGDEGGIDFETRGDNCLIDRCTFRNNPGPAIEVLGLKTPQARNTRITRCRFDRNSWGYKNGPCEVWVWGGPRASREVCCSNGIVEDNGYVLVPGVPFYRNDSPTTNDWTLVGNRAFDFPEELDRAYPWGDPPTIDLCGEIWTDRPSAALAAKVAFSPERADAKTSVVWEQVEGRPGVSFGRGPGACATAMLPGVGDYRVNVTADDGTLWRTARTAIHVLPTGSETFRVWNFARNLDSEGWSAQSTGAAYERLEGVGFMNAESFPVRMVCGDYFVIAVVNSADACIVTPETRNVGVSFSRERADRMRIRMQNRTNSRAMRLWWKTRSSDGWTKASSVAFAVRPDDPEDSVYEVALPVVGNIRQLKLSFSDGEPVTGTVRIDYIWMGRRNI